MSLPWKLSSLTREVISEEKTHIEWEITKLSKKVANCAYSFETCFNFTDGRFWVTKKFLLTLSFLKENTRNYGFLLCKNSPCEEKPFHKFHQSNLYYFKHQFFTSEYFVFSEMMKISRFPDIFRKWYWQWIVSRDERSASKRGQYIYF